MPEVRIFPPDEGQRRGPISFPVVGNSVIKHNVKVEMLIYSEVLGDLIVLLTNAAYVVKSGGILLSRMSEVVSCCRHR